MPPDTIPSLGFIEVLSTAGDAAIVLATVAIALFTWLLWGLQKEQQRFIHEATLAVVESNAVYSVATNEIRVELVIHSESLRPALIHSWEIHVADGGFQQPLGDGTLGKTITVRVPRYVGGEWWSVGQDNSPIGFAIVKPALQALSANAKVSVTINYSGGRKTMKKIEETIAVVVEP